MKNLLFASVAFMLFFACSNETVFEEKDDSTIDVVTKSINDNGPFFIPISGKGSFITIVEYRIK